MSLKQAIKNATATGFWPVQFCRVLTILRQIASHSLITFGLTFRFRSTCDNDERHCREIVEKNRILRCFFFQH